MDSPILVAIIGGTVTVFNVIFSTLMASKAEKKRVRDMDEMRQNARTKELENGVQAQ